MHQLMLGSFVDLLFGEFHAEARFRAHFIFGKAGAPARTFLELHHGFICSLLGRFSFDERRVVRE